MQAGVGSPFGIVQIEVAVRTTLDEDSIYANVRGKVEHLAFGRIPYINRYRQRSIRVGAISHRLDLKFGSSWSKIGARRIAFYRRGRCLGSMLKTW
jgi:hypothetical protein